MAVRRLDEGKRIANEIIEDGGNADVVYFDATKEETFESMIKEVAEKEGRLDILVNNFGSTEVATDKDVVTGDTDKFFDIVNMNLKSVYVPSKAAIPYMIKSGGGSIINISSVGGKFPDVTRTAYGVSKCAINFLTKDIATQYASQKIRCNAVLPGFIATDAAMKNMSEEFLNMFLRTVPLGRPGEVEDIANAVLFFASEMSSFITGETLEVSGGFGVPSPMYPMYKDMAKNG